MFALFMKTMKQLCDNKIFDDTRFKNFNLLLSVTCWGTDLQQNKLLI